MNPVFLRFLGSLLRHLLTYGSGYLVTKGILAPGDVAPIVEEAVNYGVPILCVLAAALYSTFKERFHSRGAALIVVLALGGADLASAQSQDGINLSAATIHGVPDVAAWPATLDVSAVEFAPGKDRGVRLVYSRTVLNARWPDVVVWPPEGLIQWTLFACVPVPAWECGGMHEMWGNRNIRGEERNAPREWSGAPWLEMTEDGRINNWQGNWAYDGRWGNMQRYVPKEGDEVVFFMVAGSLRPGSSHHPTVRERSHAVRVRLLRQGLAVPLTEGTPTPTPTPTPIPPVITPPPAPPTADYTALAQVVANVARDVTALQAYVQTVQGELRALEDQTRLAAQDVQGALTTLGLRVQALESRPWPIACEAALNLGLRVPVSCKLRY